MSKFTKYFVIIACFFIGLLVLAALISQWFEKPESKPTNIFTAPLTPMQTTLNVTLRNTVVKKLSNAHYRYFFFIDNNNSISFTQVVEIGLLEENNIQITFDDFTPNPPIPPGQSRFCYLDSKFGPPGSFTSLIITGFEWRIKNSD